jgi:hypothetical protein
MGRLHQGFSNLGDTAPHINLKLTLNSIRRCLSSSATRFGAIERSSFQSLHLLSFGHLNLDPTCLYITIGNDVADSQ